MSDSYPIDGVIEDAMSESVSWLAPVAMPLGWVDFEHSQTPTLVWGIIPTCRQLTLIAIDGLKYIVHVLALARTQSLKYHYHILLKI